MLNFGPRRRTRKSPPAWEWRISDNQDEGVAARLLIETVAPGGGKSKGVYLQAVVHGLEGFELSDVNHRSARSPGSGGPRTPDHRRDQVLGACARAQRLTRWLSQPALALPDQRPKRSRPVAPDPIYGRYARQKPLRPPSPDGPRRAAEQGRGLPVIEKSVVMLGLVGRGQVVHPHLLSHVVDIQTTDPSGHETRGCHPARSFPTHSRTQRGTPGQARSAPDSNDAPKGGARRAHRTHRLAAAWVISPISSLCAPRRWSSSTSTRFTPNRVANVRLACTGTTRSLTPWMIVVADGTRMIPATASVHLA